MHPVCARIPSMEADDRFGRMNVREELESEDHLNRW
jgi:hypothetical protein